MTEPTHVSSRSTGALQKSCSSGVKVLTHTDWCRMSWNEADQSVADVVCRWPEAIGFDPVIDGIDYSIVVRQHLWPVVSAAARRIRGQIEFREWLGQQGLSDTATSKTGDLKSLARRSSSFVSAWPRSVVRRMRGRSTVLLPFPHQSWRNTKTAIENVGRSVITEVPIGHGFRRKQRLACAGELADWFVDRIADGLKRWSIDLSEPQVDRLRQCVALSRAYVDMAECRLSRHRPELLIVNTSATSPTVEYVLAARRQQTSTLAIQYGLDCDRYAYDDALADNVAVWSENRRQQYLSASTRTPAVVRVTGNPEYDGRRLPERSQPNGSYWLWVTRPHSPNRCKLASQNPIDGLCIMRGILRVLDEHPQCRLLIKPHHNDYIQLYIQLARASVCRNRVTITNRPLGGLLQEASLVITEDTTAGLDSLYFGKPLIHAHFGQTAPVLPFDDYQAAIPASDQDNLIEAIRCLAGNHGVLDQLQGQHRFLREFSGQVDGGSSERLTNFIARSSGVR